MIKIYVVCHKKSIVLENPCLIPIQVGAAIAKERLTLNHMVYDDAVEPNISERNPSYCELTAQYAVWQMLEQRKAVRSIEGEMPTHLLPEENGSTGKEPENSIPENSISENKTPDYVGFFHYRRYMSFDKIVHPQADGTLRKEDQKIVPNVEVDSITDDLSKFKLTADAMEQAVEGRDIVTVLRENINTSVYAQYVQFHSKASIDQALEILYEKYPEYREAARRYLDSKSVYYLNMFIMKQEIYQEYAKWLFDIMLSYEQTEGYKERIKEEPRLMGFISERLFGIFYTKKLMEGARTAELQYIKFYDTDGNPEAARQQYIREFQIKPLPWKIKIDMRKLNKMFPSGSRRRIWLRSWVFKE